MTHAEEWDDMEYRDDVRDLLTAQGWTEDAKGVLRHGAAMWTELNFELASALDGPTYAVEFSAEVPAEVIAAACQAALTTMDRR